MCIWPALLASVVWDTSIPHPIVWAVQAVAAMELPEEAPASNPFLSRPEGKRHKQVANRNF